MLYRGAWVGYAGRAELAGSAPWIKQACLTPQAPAAWGHHSPKQDPGEVGSLVTPARATRGWWQRGGSRRSQGAAPCHDPRTAARGCLARLCLGCLSWPEQELGEGQTARSDGPRGKRAKASRERSSPARAGPGSAQGAPASTAGKAFRIKPAGWRQELDPGKHGPK